MKRKLIIVPLVLGLLAAGVLGGTALAFGGKHGGGGFDQSPLIERVAEILGLESDAVSEAFATASQELWAERVDAIVAAMVERGVISEEEAAEYRERMLSGEEPFHFGRGHGRGFGFGEGFKGRRFHRFAPEPSTDPSS